MHSHGLCLLCQIVVLNKAKERLQPFHSNQEEEDPDIKKIKKVNGRAGRSSTEQEKKLT